MAQGHKTDKYRKRKQKEKQNRKAKHAVIIVDSREPKDLVDKLIESGEVDVKVMSPARRAFQDV